MTISRAAAVQAFLDLFDRPSYLEVGVFKGETFNSLTAARKVAVDPLFRFAYRDFEEAHIAFHQVESDEYFGRIAAPDDLFDVIYLDGLHTVEQTLRDLNNALMHLKRPGVLLIDDILPSSYHASLPDRTVAEQVRKHMRDPSGRWMGDVYKLCFFIDSFFQKFSYATIEENHGQLVMWMDGREAVPQRPLMDIAQLQFSDVVMQREVFRLRPHADIVEEVRGWLGSFERS